MKTFGQKALINEQQPPPIPQQGIGQAQPPPIRPKRPTEPLKPAPTNIEPTMTFGQKARELIPTTTQQGTRWTTPFHLGALRFQKDKYYFINIQHPGGFRLKDPEEALEQFLQYTGKLKAGRQQPEVDISEEQFDILYNFSDDEFSQFCKDVITEVDSKELTKNLQRIKKNRRRREQNKQKTEAEHQEEMERNQELGTDDEPGIDSKHSLPFRETVFDLVDVFHKYNIVINPKQVANLIEKNLFNFLEKLRDTFPEFRISYQYSEVKKAKKINKQTKEPITYIVFTPKEVISAPTFDDYLRREQEIILKMREFIQGLGLEFSNASAGKKLYNNLSSFLLDLTQTFKSQDGKELLHLSFDNIMPFEKPQCHPFTKEGNINDFVCWVNVIESYMTEAARNNVGVTPYMIVEEFLVRGGLREDPEQTFNPAISDAEDDAMVTAHSEGVVTEQEGGVFRTAESQHGTNGYRRLSRYQAGGEIISTPGRLKTQVRDPKKIVGKLLHASPEQIRSFHDDMVKWFIRTGYILYLTPEQYDNILRRGGMFTAAIKGVANQIYQAGAAAPKVRL